MTNPNLVVHPQSTTSCWRNFVNGTSKTANWCGRQVSSAATAAWGGVQKVASLTASFFHRAAFHCSRALSASVTFVKANSSHFLVTGIAVAILVPAALMLNHYYGCANSPAKAEDLPAVKRDIEQRAEDALDGAAEANTDVLDQADNKEAARLAAAAAAGAPQQPED